MSTLGPAASTDKLPSNQHLVLCTDHSSIQAENRTCKKTSSNLDVIYEFEQGTGIKTDI